MENEIVLQEILAQLAMIRETNERLTAQLQKKDSEIERLNQIILNMQRARFGQRSENANMFWMTVRGS